MQSCKSELAELAELGGHNSELTTEFAERAELAELGGGTQSCNSSQPANPRHESLCEQ